MNSISKHYLLRDWKLGVFRVYAIFHEEICAIYFTHFSFLHVAFHYLFDVADGIFRLIFRLRPHASALLSLSWDMPHYSIEDISPLFRTDINIFVYCAYISLNSLHFPSFLSKYSSQKRHYLYISLSFSASFIYFSAYAFLSTDRLR